MYCCLRNDVCIESITEVDWIDIVTALKTFCQRINNQRLRIEHKTWRKAQMGRAIEDGSPLQIAIHDGEKDLKEKIHGIDKYREEVQPCFTGHHHYLFGASSCLEGLRADCSRGLWDMGRNDRRINFSRVVEFSLLDTEGLFCPLPRFQKSQKKCIVLVHRQ